MPGKVRAILETIGAISIILSLVFVGYQLRQANDIARLQVLQEHAAQWRETNLALAANPEFMRLSARTDSGAVSADFEAAELSVLDAINSGLIHGWEANFKQLQLGILEPDDITFPPPTTPIWSSPYQREYWARARGSYSEEFAVFWEDRFGLNEPQRPR